MSIVTIERIENIMFSFCNSGKYIKKVIDDQNPESPITIETLQTYSVVLSNRINIELKEINSILDKANRNSEMNKIMLLNAFLECFLEELKQIKHDYLMK